MTDKGRPSELTNVHLRQLTTALQSIRQAAAEMGLNLEKMPRQVREELLGPKQTSFLSKSLGSIQTTAKTLPEVFKDLFFVGKQQVDIKLQFDVVVAV
jgi:hypothetical protein